MTIDAYFALLQIPLAMWAAVLYGRQYRHRNEPAFGYPRIRRRLLSATCLIICAVSCGMAAWRMATVSEIVTGEYRTAGGMIAQTLYQGVLLIAYFALKGHSGSEK